MERFISFPFIGVIMKGTPSDLIVVNIFNGHRLIFSVLNTTTTDFSATLAWKTLSLSLPSVKVFISIIFFALYSK